jgi:DNA polymerase-3 subunit beta
MNFNDAVASLNALSTKPLSTFDGTPYSADDLEKVGRFIGDMVSTIPRAVVEQITRRKTSEIKLRIDTSIIVASADNVVLTAKLIDGTFPDYERVIPAATGNAIAEVERIALMASLDRMAAVGAMPTMTLGWSEQGAMRLTVGGGEIAEDVLDAETTGEAEIGLAIGRFRNLIGAIDAERLRLEIVSATDPILVNPIGNGNLLTLLMPCVAVTALKETRGEVSR